MCPNSDQYMITTMIVVVESFLARRPRVVPTHPTSKRLVRVGGSVVRVRVRLAVAPRPKPKTIPQSATYYTVASQNSQLFFQSLACGRLLCYTSSVYFPSRSKGEAKPQARTIDVGSTAVRFAPFYSPSVRAAFVFT